MKIVIPESHSRNSWFMLCWPRANERYRKNFFGNQFVFEEGVSSTLFNLPRVCSASLGQLCLESTAQTRL